MFTGIVQAQLPVKRLEKKEGHHSLTIGFPGELMGELATGASVAVNGVCLTVTAIDDNDVSFDAIRETLALSNIGGTEAGDLVNIERSAKQGDEIGGHLLSGHVTGTAEAVQVEGDKNNCRITLSGDPRWMKFVFEKGFLAVNGASLTVAELDRAQRRIAVNLIPETLKRTNFSQVKRGDLLNIEVDAQTRAIVETVERVMAERQGA